MSALGLGHVKTPFQGSRREENRGMVRWPTSCRRLRLLKAHLSQIERIDKYVDHANRVALANEIIKAFGQ
jgi:hypothetical protein